MLALPKEQLLLGSKDDVFDTFMASRLLNTGGTLKEVADVLRHRELNTSQI